MNRVDIQKIGEILVNDLKVPQKYVNETLKKSKNENVLFGVGASKLKLIDNEKITCALAKQFGLNYLPYTEIFKNFYYESYIEEKFYKDIFQFQTSEHFMEFCLENKFYILNDNKDENFFTHLLNNDCIIKKGIGKGSIALLLGDYDNFQIETHINKCLKKYKNIYLIAANDTLFFYIRTRYMSPNLDEIEEFFKKSNDDTTTEIALRMLLTYSIANNVSDIHIEPNYDNKYRVSGRKDGERITFFYMNNLYGTRLIGVVKNKSKMDLQIKRKPQDGQLSGSEELKKYTLPIKRGIAQQEPNFDFSDTSFRISTYPNADIETDASVSTESMVLRILNSDESLAILSNLNLSKKTEEELLYSVKQRSGIIIVSGPTGSGKTTTLYAILSQLDYLSEKIITFEDPVEIRNKFWTQGEKNLTSNDSTRFTFLDAKKSILRQDPDIILMGEIRDEESAKFAIEAANTGHLVFATLHANSSMLVINRLIELNVDKSEIINSIRCSFSQRLIKRLCPHCRKKIEVKQDNKIMEFLKRNEIIEDLWPKFVYDINLNGCKYCNNTGFKGRVLIDEVIPFNNKIKESFGNTDNLISMRNKITEDFNFPTMILNGIEKSKEGVIPFSELNKLI